MPPQPAVPLPSSADDLSPAGERRTQGPSGRLESRFRGVLEAAPDAMVVVDQHGNIVLVNLQAERAFGYPHDELIGQAITHIVPKGFAERLIEDGTRSAAAALAQRIGTGSELSGLRKDGSAFPIEMMLSPLANGESILVAAAIRDISVRKAAERQLAQSEEQYRLLLDGVQDHAILMLDPQGTVLTWNSGAQRIKGYSAAQIIGHNFACFFLPEDIARGRPQEVLRLASAAGRHEEEVMRVRGDGSQFLARVTFTALRDAAGTLRGFTEFSHDLSARQAGEARYRGLLEAAPDAMVVVDPAGEIVLLNRRAEKQFGYRACELLGQPVTNLLPEGFAERLVSDGKRSASEALAQQIGTGIELSGRRRDGSRFPVEIMLSPLHSAEGILVTAAIRDISVRKSAAADLLRKVEELDHSNRELARFASMAHTANQELEAFAYSVSHDLRAPLRTLDGFSLVLLEDYGDRLDAEGRDSLVRIRKASQRMGLLIDDMLALSQVSRHELRLSRVDLSAMALSIVEELQLREPQRSVSFSCAPDLFALTDSHLIRIALINLLANAWKFTGKRSHAHIEFGTVDHQGKPAYVVRDDGAGFDMAYAGKLFGAFQRMHGAKEFEGTGIGLATVRRVILRLGGKVWAEAAVEKGAAFFFVLGGNG